MLPHKRDKSKHPYKVRKPSSQQAPTGNALRDLNMPTELTGVAFPLQVDKRTGNLVTASDADLISTHIRSVLGGEPGEMPMRPSYGTPGVLFTSQPDFSSYSAKVQRILTAEIPQAKFSVRGELGEAGEALLTVDWIYNNVSQPGSVGSGTIQVEIT